METIMVRVCGWCPDKKILGVKDGKGQIEETTGHLP